MKTASLVGQGFLYLLAGSLLLWAWDRTKGAKLLYLLTASASVNAVLKAWIHEPRPYWLTDRITGYEIHTSFGMPSGHAQSAMVFFGLTALLWRNLWVRVASGLTILLIGTSRVTLGVHSPAQVATGWAVGLGLLAVFHASDRRAGNWITRRGPASAVTFGLSMLFVASGVVLSHAYAHWHPDPSWRAGRPFPSGGLPVSDVFRNTGLFLGLGLGLANFGRKQTTRGRILWLRLGLGLAVMFAILAAGRLVHLRSLPGWVQFCAAAVLGTWIAAVPTIVPAGPTQEQRNGRDEQSLHEEKMQ